MFTLFVQPWIAWIDYFLFNSMYKIVCRIANPKLDNVSIFSLFVLIRQGREGTSQTVTLLTYLQQAQYWVEPCLYLELATYLSFRFLQKWSLHITKHYYRFLQVTPQYYSNILANLCNFFINISILASNS